MILPELDTHISRTQEKLPDLTSFNLSAISSDQNGCVTLSNMTKARVPLGVPKNTDNTDSSGTKTALPLSSRTTIMKGASQSSMSIAARVKARRNAARQNLAPRLSEESLSSRSKESYKSDSISSDGSESYRSDDADQTAGSLTIAGTSSDASEDGGVRVVTTEKGSQSPGSDADNKSDGNNVSPHQVLPVTTTKRPSKVSRILTTSSVGV